MIQFAREICGDLKQASSLEWLETNGLGGFASSTITGLNTRRYHGLLVAATQPPVGRRVLLSKLEEVLRVGEARFDLASNQYPGAIYPRGFDHLNQFRLDPYPIFTFEAGGVTIEKHVCMLYEENSTVILYKLTKTSTQAPICIELRPLIAFRDYHATTHENSALNEEVRESPGQISVTPYPGLPTLHLGHNAVGVEIQGDWYRAFQYERERERGLDFEEDLFNPCCLRFELAANHAATIIVSTEPRDAMEATQWIANEVKRRLAIENSAGTSPLSSQLATAADQFLVRRGRQKTVIAGYHWFGDWGRDTMISLPGLTLATGRTGVAKEILLEFSQYVSEGMVPNRFPDAGTLPEYNTADATLWYFEAIRAYHALTGDDMFVQQQLYPVLLDIIDWHVKGTRYCIRVEDDGLLHAGEPGVQLTWMDAKIGDWVVTPRTGKPVEIQALWYNALCTMESFAARYDDDTSSQRFERMATSARASFNRVFWNQGTGCLYDVVSEANDASIRPNQIFAVSLHHSMLSAERARQVVDVVQRDLLTPVGLRTLSPTDPRYIGKYEGDQRSRDAAYHQGTVWPWLMGPFVEAYIKVKGNVAPVRQQVTTWLDGFADLTTNAGLGTISEIMEGDAPHRPCGCIAQAWSVAELLRVVELIQSGGSEQKW